MVLALDVGDVRIGMARTDALGITAQPVGVLTRSELTADLERLLAVIQEHSVDLVVVGLPLRMDGTDSPQTTKVRQFADSLGKVCPVPLEWSDERLTTEEAEAVLTKARVRGKKRKRVVDVIAAQIILQDWLADHPSEY